MTRLLTVLVFSVAAASSHAAAQGLRFNYPAPPAGTIAITRDATYGTAGGTALKMDVFRPAADPGRARPVLIFFNRAVGADRYNDFYVGWARTAASRDLIAILPDLRPDTQAQDFDALLTHLSTRAADYGGDANAIAVYAGSGNVFTAFPLVEDPARTAVKAAVMYYGGAEIPSFRLDLPVLVVRAGLDRPALNRNMIDLASRGILQNAPVTVLNHPTGHHAFEMMDDDAGTREIIDRTIDFVKRSTAAAYQAAIRINLAEAAAAGQALAGNHRQAATGYAALVSERPDNASLRLAYGEVLLADGQFAPACAEFEKLKGQGLGPRDLGLPAARACLQKGDAEAAMAWLKSIPQRFLPASVATEPVFAPLRDRADFKALFSPR